MKILSYQDFRASVYGVSKKLNAACLCQFELTYQCDYHCRYCYTDCYNNKRYFKKELDTSQIKFILDKLYGEGIVWLCFTGGDPLKRSDFPVLYRYAKRKGFIITIFTNGYSLTREMSELFKSQPPFAIEITVDGAEPRLYDMITGLKNSFDIFRKNIDRILAAGIPLKIKTRITRANLYEWEKIKKFVNGLGLVFRPAFYLHARLNGDQSPCRLRLLPQEAFFVYQYIGMSRRTKKKLFGRFWHGDERNIREYFSQDMSRYFNEYLSKQLFSPHDESQNNKVFSCALGTCQGMIVDPYGNAALCLLLREPRYSLFNREISWIQKQFQSITDNTMYRSKSKCRWCNVRSFCYNCPGKAYLEKGDREASLDFFCQWTKFYCQHSVSMF